MSLNGERAGAGVGASSSFMVRVKTSDIGNGVGVDAAAATDDGETGAAVETTAGAVRDASL
ncbi:MAG TPA: hypothetical protein VJS66_00890 [Burkholderiales bacterium]|nr:hypothetical protein [Burkholderiales bacterium]